MVLDEPIDSLPRGIGDHFPIEQERFAGQRRFVRSQGSFDMAHGCPSTVVPAQLEDSLQVFSTCVATKRTGLVVFGIKISATGW
jgi:hypothetical protein